MTTVTRRYRFPASHRLYLPTLNAADNLRLFGKCSNPFGHGHDYVLSVTVKGKVDAHSGLIVRTRDLDELVEQEILQMLRYRNLNADVAQFEQVVPTTENVALVIAHLLESQWGSRFGDQPHVRLWRIHLQETDRNGFEVRANDFHPKIALIARPESTVLHV